MVRDWWALTEKSFCVKRKFEIYKKCETVLSKELKKKKASFVLVK